MSNPEDASTMTETTTQTSVQSQHFWFEDGNIVLQAEDTLFRVYLGIMSKHSRVFKDMHSPGFKSNIADQLCTKDGCPIVPLQDKPTDVELLLSVIFEPLKIRSILMKPTFNQLYALLRITEKYQFDDIHKAVAARFISDFPTKLDDFTSMYALHLIHRGPQPCECGAMACKSEQLIKIINIATTSTENNLQQVLPVAYLLASGLTVSEILSGVPSTDSEGGVISLSPQSREVLFNGQRSLQQDLITRASNIPFYYAKNSCGREFGECGPRTQTWVEKAMPLLASAKQFWRTSFISIDQTSCWGYQSSESGWCNKCRGSVAKHFNSVRGMLWENLPKYYGLPSWDKLATLESTAA